MTHPRKTGEYKRKRAAFLATHEHVCHWCGAAVYTSLPRQHPRKATIDHLVEVDLVASMALDESLWVIACHSCNSSRGASYGHGKRANAKPATRRASRTW